MPNESTRIENIFREMTSFERGNNLKGAQNIRNQLISSFLQLDNSTFTAGFRYWEQSSNSDKVVISVDKGKTAFPLVDRRDSKYKGSHFYIKRKVTHPIEQYGTLEKPMLVLNREGFEYDVLGDGNPIVEIGPGWGSYFGNTLIEEKRKTEKAMDVMGYKTKIIQIPLLDNDKNFHSYFRIVDIHKRDGNNVLTLPILTDKELVKDINVPFLFLDIKADSFSIYDPKKKEFIIIKPGKDEKMSTLNLSPIMDYVLTARLEMFDYQNFFKERISIWDLMVQSGEIESHGEDD